MDMTRKSIRVFLIIIIAIILLFSVVSLLIYVPRNKMKSFLDSLEPETVPTAYAVRYDSLVLEDTELNLKTLLQKEHNETPNYLRYICVYDSRIYFIFTKAIVSDDADSEISWRLHLASTTLDAADLKIHYCEDMESIFLWKHNETDFSQMSAYHSGDAIVLNRNNQVVKYDISDNCLSFIATDEFIYPEIPLEYEIQNHDSILFTMMENNNTIYRTLSVQNVIDQGGSVSALYKYADQKIWSGGSGAKYFFDSIQIIDEKIFIICEVLNFSGESYAVVLEYFFDTNTCAYVQYSFMGDHISDNYYLI